MIWQNIMKYPVLIMGVLMFAVFLLNENTQKWLGDHVYRFKPNDCRVQLDRVIDKNKLSWSSECKNNELWITHKVDVTDKDLNVVKGKIYRQLANDYAHLAQISNDETLERIQKVRIHIEHNQFKINSSSKGSDVIRLKKMKDQSQIARHLKFTVKVKEL
jgi:hypothetical protein